MNENVLEMSYIFHSCIASRMESDCIQEVKVKIYSLDEENNHREWVGEVEFKIIHIDRAEVNGFNIYDVFDEYEYTFRHSQEFYDFEKNQFKDNLLEVFPDLDYTKKICIIEKIIVKPKFRGNKLGAKIFKDIVFNFDYCELFIVQPYPLQFDNSLENDFREQYNLHQLEQNERKAIHKLQKYYQTWGLRKIKGIKDLMFFSTIYRNDIFDSIEMGY